MRLSIAVVVSGLILATQAQSGHAAPTACKPSEYAADTYFPKPAFAREVP